MILLALLAQIAAPQPAPALKPCAAIDPGRPFIAFDTQLVRVGNTVRIRPMVSHAWFGDEEVRWDCFGDWTVSDPNIARIDAARGVLIVAGDAPADSIVTVSATFRRTESIASVTQRASLHILVRGAQVLTGTWSEAARRNCAGETIGELIFRPRGAYSFTYSSMMVETMTSGGGPFTWDAASLKLTLGDKMGMAQLTDWKGAKPAEPGVLVIAGIDFYPRTPAPPAADGSVLPHRPCVLTFRRVK